jgi:hypothetical protein
LCVYLYGLCTMKMKLGVIILTGILILIVTSPGADIQSGNQGGVQAMILEMQRTVHSPLSACFEERDRDNPNETATGSISCYREGILLSGFINAPRLNFTFHFHPNLLLIDRPPPGSVE